MLRSIEGSGWWKAFVEQRKEPLVQRAVPDIRLPFWVDRLTDPGCDMVIHKTSYFVFDDATVP